MPRTLTGPQKAAVLLMQMGTDRAAKVLKTLRETEVEKIMAEITQLRSVDATVVDDVFKEFREIQNSRALTLSGGLDFAREVLEEGLGAVKAHEILDRLSVTLTDTPFDFLRRADPRQVLSFLQDEHPQTIALVLAYMHPEPAALVLSGLADELQADVAHRVALMDRTSPEVVKQVESVLERKLSTVLQSSDFSTAGGVQPLVDILNRSDRSTERLILEGLERNDPELADQVRSRMFVFEDVVLLDDRSVQLVLREVDPKDLALALKGVRDDVREKILRNISERAAVNLVEEIDMLGPVRMKAVEEAQGGIVRVIRRLEEAGQIVVSRGGADEFVE